jgi:hypothetical protein
MRNFIAKLKHFFQSAWKKFSKKFLPGKKAGYGATIGIFVGFALATLMVTFSYLSSLGWIVIIVMSLGLLAASFGTAWLSVKLLRLLNLIPFWLMVALLVGWPVLMMYFHTKMPATLLIFIVIVTFSAMTGGALWLIRTKWKKSKTFNRGLIVGNLLLGLAGIIAFMVWMFYPGKMVEMPANASMSEQVILPPQLTIENPATPGQFKVNYLTYANGTDRHRKEFGEDAGLITETVDGSNFLEWDGFGNKLRTKYFGFDHKKLPLNARVWYPEGNGPFPLVLIVHGNHLAQDFSDPGYEYLGELLASRGYIFASVDENFLNGSYTNIFSGLNNENDARAWMLLKHLEVWRDWNNEPEHFFHGKVDMDNIALIGHSRGGEAVGHAALFNRLPFYPDNALETFDFNFNIRSIIAIAPVDGQYQPANIRTPLTDINYFTLQGSHDADLTSYQAMRQYNRIGFSEGFDGFKAGLYIFFANHGQFNSVWGNKDFGPPRINYFNLKQLISERDQQKIAQVYISGFLEATLGQNREYRSMFMDHRTARNWLPETIYLNQYEQSGTQFVTEFTEDLDLSTASLPGSFIEAYDMSIWKEKKLPLNWGDYDDRGVILGWNFKDNDTLQPCYNITWQPGEIATNSNSILVFSMADTGDKADPPPVKDDDENDENDNKNGKNNSGNEKDEETKEETEGEDDKPEMIDFTIQLTDVSGNICRFPLSKCSPLQPLLKRKMTKMSFMQTSGETESIQQFLYFPLNELDCTMQEFDIENIAGISFIFDRTPTGVIAVSNIGFITQSR